MSLKYIKKIIRILIECMRLETEHFSNYYYYIKNKRVDESFREVIQKEYLLKQRNRILRYYENNSNESVEYQHEIECLKRNLPYFMTCDVDDFNKACGKIREDLKSIAFDEECSLYYLIRFGRKLYFKRSLDSFEKVKEYYEYLAYEQTENSPHRYLDETFDIEKGSVVVDCGAAEGIFGLDNIDKIGFLYNFECDLEWIEALKHTFSPYLDKVAFVPKYIGDTDKEEMVSLDSYFENKRIDFLKMDIEGYEEKVLQGAKRILSDKSSIKIVTAAYHSKDAYESICAYLSNFNISTSKGYLLHGWEVSEPPFFRHGVIRAEKL